MAKTISARMIRGKARQTAKRSIDEAQERNKIKLTPAARRLILSTIAMTLNEKSEDLIRIGPVEKRPNKAGKGRISEFRISPKIDVSKATQSAIYRVIDYAAGEHKKGTVVTVADLDSAIRAKWCSIFPICGESTGKKMGLKVQLGDLK